jgi:AraC-like DNA-binding protein
MKKHPEYNSAFNYDLSETVAYNNPLFPVYTRYDILSTYPDYSAISHWHKDLEFIVVRKGSMTYNINGKLVELTDGNGIMVNSRQLHYGFSAQHNECEFICIIISPELLQGNEWFYQNFVEHITENSACPYLLLGRSADSCCWQASVLDRLEHLYASFGTDPAAPCSNFEVIEDFTFIMKMLYENLKTGNPAKKQESAELSTLKKMIAYIDDHYTEHIRLEDIALSGACCKSRCSMLFKKYLRDTPVAYVTKLRLRKSLAILLDLNKNITDVAYECGFSGTSYYCETFKKYYGTSPLLYKKMHRQS